MKNLEKNYNPKEFEDKIYKIWENEGYFKGIIDKDKKPFTIVMPPPNVTGNLHLGHALNNTIQDILIRKNRMDGYSALWVPGTDHASIATEAKVVNKLKEEGKSKESLGRDGFLEASWDWTREYGGNIKNQLKKLGVSCDWSREAFTLDDNLTEAVEEVFIKMYNDDLIYQGDRIVNWCPNCHTAISDIEVIHEDESGHFWNIRYKFKDSEDYIVIATTRPETLLGDLAVAVNPDDERYTDIVGKTLILPLVNREIKVIADSYVDMEFGTGIVKITPSHDPNDFEVGARHNLGQCIVIDEDAKIVEGYGKYSGLDRYEARKLIIEDLEKIGQLDSVKDHEHAVGHCERCHTTVEPLISKQWFVKMDKLAKLALDAYKKEEIRFIPKRFEKVYVNWLENIRDWCISRQLWWGHRLPVYYHNETGEVVVARENPDQQKYTQDPDTLDTWFSSALWPFSTLGWPHETEDLKYFFPTNVLVTGYDIIFFWVIRMVFSSLYNLGEVPFKDVYLTGLVKDSQGRKMSKSLGNGIDPIEVIDQYGADALRFALITGNTPGNDSRFYMEKVEANRNFCNKLWNASRFVFMNVEENVKNIDEVELQIEDKWIISSLNNVIDEVSTNLNKYEIGIAAEKIYDFTWNVFCDWYIELVKPRLYGDNAKLKESAISVLIYTLTNVIKLLHPFMPYITEEIYSYLPNKNDMLINETWPKYSESNSFKKEEEIIDKLVESVISIRNSRQEMNIAPKKQSDVYILTSDKSLEDDFKQLESLFRSSVSINEYKVNEDISEENNIVIVKDSYKIIIPLNDLIDYSKELERLEKELNSAKSELKRAESKLKNEGFLKGAPENLVEKEKEKVEKYSHLIDDINNSICSIKEKM
ncbi:MAG: valine--tRNA ligase [Finegoldia magna]|uniref:Valine--tRNA ligase n=2 Tax=Finegoldia magna TaxID=1260 RepID=A0A233W1N3_FINMA|nr:valine--tRNA ligase [Finegoldia magna]EFK93616.1 valine--tRNA ligase [Finegoldia magna ACS-171-V-Col3]EFL54878.1 valine--tRNA ligase [Finegoldia magna BVS033A4]EXF26854.1 valyl-tRNA synthetase [Finegoldia magna ALB8]MDU5525963.1 valine--tRNA ligase [Finegoldia magna]OXZ38553.1 valine--tRNA ligase [Finegoldia magna]